MTNETGVASMAPLSDADRAQWAFGTGLPHQPCPGRMGFAERMIGLIWRRDIDHIVVLLKRLRRISRSYGCYYNDIRTHRLLDKDAPVSRPVQRIRIISSHAILGG
jgi:hypothetical protein